MQRVATGRFGTRKTLALLAVRTRARAAVAEEDSRTAVVRVERAEVVLLS
jgi:hypothetical protein